jgi:hypothetical protein
MKFEYSTQCKGRLNWNESRLSSVVGDASSRETDKNGTQGPLKQGSMSNMNKDVASIVGEGGADSQSLDKRMDKLEAAVQGLTSMVAKMSEKLDNMVRLLCIVIIYHFLHLESG